MARRLTILLVVLVVVAAACGDDGGALTEGERAVAAAIAEGMAVDPDPGDPFADPEAARCFSEGIVRELGVGRLAEIGITADSAGPDEAFALLTEAEIDTLVDHALECVDLEAALSAEFESGGLSAGSARCLVEALEETGFFRQAFVAGMRGDDTYDPSRDPEFLTVMITAASECLTPEELSLIMGG